jgi:hypothetical protein
MESAMLLLIATIVSACLCGAAFAVQERGEPES